MTPKQKKFADEYIQSGNATKSAIKAGYSKKTAYSVGSENLRKHEIKQYIDERMSLISNQNIMSAREAVEILTSVGRGEIKETVVVATPQGVEVIEKEPDIKTRISAIKEILKRYPDNDKLMAQQLRKTTAEADIAETKAKEMADNDRRDVTITIVQPENWGDDDAES